MRFREPKGELPTLPEKPQRPGWVTQVREYELITPLFGGGVKAGEVDPITPISGKGIRGQLRFWWRATRGGQFDTVEAMKKAEDRLWGTAATASKDHETGADRKVKDVKVRLGVTEISLPDSLDGSLIKPFTIHVKNGRWISSPNDDSGVPPYVAFPLQPTRDEVRNGVGKGQEKEVLQEGVRFKLLVSYFVGEKKDESDKHSVQEDIEAALWAWETFGGIGARTRRGFGAVSLQSINSLTNVKPSPRTMQDSLLEKYNQYVTGKPPANVPGLVKHLVVSNATFGDPLEAWSYAVDIFKDFRQQRNSGTQHNRPGRSKWPEPDAIRRATHRTADTHRVPVSNIDKYPRAVFGLPIIFHFKDERVNDPFDTSLQGVTEERLASPLIIRPLQCSNDRHVALIAVLRTPTRPPSGLQLRGDGFSQNVSERVSSSEAALIPPLRGERNALTAFLNYFVAKDK